MTLTIAAHDHGRVDVFSIDLPAAEAAQFDADPARLGVLLGETPLATQVDIFDTAVMGDLGLHGYLREGIGVPEEALAPHAATLGNITHAVVLRAEAFPERPVTLHPQPPLNHVVTLGERAAEVDLTPLQSTSASGSLQPPPIPGTVAPRIPKWVWAMLAVIFFAILVAIIPIFARS
ncbi:hypothetical protein [Pseudaestuariivita sp.]|uniref:hypothetical protein n=1 Tax=Pseudaestuariivita sp. TaxID=2211669 RepID=UPI0040594AF2